MNTSIIFSNKGFGGLEEMALDSLATSQLSASQLAGTAGLMGVFAGFLVVALIIWVAAYIYSSIAMMHTAQRLKTEPAWLAWIPVARNVIVAKMSKMHWWPVLLLVASYLFSMVLAPLAWVFSIAFTVFYIIWLWKICEARKFPGWIAVLIIIPFLGQIWLMVLWGLLAWSK